MAVVELVGAAIGVPGLAEDEDVVTLAEGVGEDSARAEVDIGVVTGGLAGRGTVEVPLGELVNALDGLGEGLRGELVDDRRYPSVSHVMRMGAVACKEIACTGLIEAAIRHNASHASECRGRK